MSPASFSYLSYKSSAYWHSNNQKIPMTFLWFFMRSLQLEGLRKGGSCVQFPLLFILFCFIYFILPDGCFPSGQCIQAGLCSEPEPAEGSGSSAEAGGGGLGRRGHPFWQQSWSSITSCPAEPYPANHPIKWLHWKGMDGRRITLGSREK